MRFFCTAVLHFFVYRSMIAKPTVVLLLSIERVPLGPRYYRDFLEYKERRRTDISRLVLLLLSLPIGRLVSLEY